MITRKQLWIECFAAIGVCMVGQFAWADSGPKADVEAIRKIQYELAASDNTDKVLKLYASGNKTLVFDIVGKHAPMGIYRSAEQLAAGYAPQYAEIAKPKVTYDELDITVMGNLGVAVSVQHLVSKPINSDKTYKLTYRETDILKKVKGKWLIYHSHISVPCNGNLVQCGLVEQ